MIKYFLFIALSISFFAANAQSPVNGTVENSTLAATDDAMPLWLSSNRNGKVIPTGSFWNISELSIGQNGAANSSSSFSYSWGGNYVVALGESGFHHHLNQLFAGISLNNWALTAGAFRDPVRYAGLSTTNGNLARSRNARPYPKVRLSTAAWKPVPFTNNHLHFKAEYDEGLLNDDRYVSNARMHHKSLYFRVQPAPSWEITAGLEHHVMWSGTSRNEEIGELPRDLKAYLRYITGSSGSEEFPLTDRNNRAGNQLGTYQLEVRKYFAEMELTFYLSHPFEDLSGMNWRNWPDNLLGIHIHFNSNKPKEKQWVTDVVYEFTNTRQQSIRDSLYEWNETTGKWARQEPDNYFNHSVYKNSMTYHRQVMVSPLFFPVTLGEDGLPTDGRYALGSNRFFAHHVGARGYLFSEYLKWKGLLTYIRHLGLHGKPYDTARNQLSGLLEMHYASPRFPVELGIAIAADAGNVTGKNGGIELSIAKRF